MPKKIGFLRRELLSRRTKRIWSRMKERHTTFNITGQVSAGEYNKFIKGLNEKTFGPFKLTFRKGSITGGIVLSFEGITKRGLDSIEQIFFGKGKPLNRIGRNIKIKTVSRLFKIDFTLTRNIEQGVNFPIDITKGAGVCAITNLHGPSKRKYEGTQRLVQEANSALGKRWQIFLLEEMISQARANGCSSIALLRPEFNVDLTTEHLVKKGVLREDVDSIRSQYYSAARKTGFKKVKGSKYFWIFF